MLFCFRERPAPIRVEVKSIDDTSNFDDFPDVDMRWRECFLHNIQAKAFVNLPSLHRNNCV